MTTSKLYRAVPLASLRGCQGEVAIPTDTIVAALMQAKAVLGEGTAFDLCEGAKIVLGYRPVQKWRSVGGGQR